MAIRMRARDTTLARLVYWDAPAIDSIGAFYGGPGPLTDYVVQGDTLNETETGGGVTIGAAVTGGTVGSILFVGAGVTVSQDNANLFWDDTNNRLGIGTSTPGIFADTVVEITRSTGHCVMSLYSTAVASDGVLIIGSLAAGDTALFVDESDSIKFKIATGDVSTDAARNTNTRMTIDTSGRVGIGTSTPDVAYQLQVRRTVSGQGVALIQNTSATGFSTINFVNEVGTFILGVGHDNSSDTSYIDNASAVNPFLISWSGAANVTVNLRNLSTTGYSAVQYLNSSSVGQGSLGFANASVAITHIASRLYWYSNSADIVFANAARAAFTFGMTDGSAALTLANGSSATAAPTDTGRLRYNTTGQKSQLSHSTGGYFDVATYAAAITTGSVVFANASNQLAQDNANLFWDNTGKQLILGATAATKTATVGVAEFTRNSVAKVSLSTFSNTAAESAQLQLFRARGTAASSASVQSSDSLGVIAWGGIVQAPDTNYSGALIQGFASENWALGSGGTRVEIITTANGTAARLTRVLVDQDGGVQLDNSAAAAVSAAGTAKLRVSSNALQVSNNTGAYANVESTTVERHAVDGAANPAIKNTFVSGTGTDLTLANGTTDGFIKNFVITGGSGTLVPANLADGNTLTWTAAPANVSLIWDATIATWHVIGTPYNVVTT